MLCTYSRLAALYESAQSNSELKTEQPILLADVGRLVSGIQYL